MTTLTWPARHYPQLPQPTALARQRLSLLLQIEDTQWTILFWTLLILFWPPAYHKSKRLRQHLLHLQYQLALHKRTHS